MLHDMVDGFWEAKFHYAFHSLDEFKFSKEFS